MATKQSTPEQTPDTQAKKKTSGAKGTTSGRSVKKAPAKKAAPTEGTAKKQKAGRVKLVGASSNGAATVVAPSDFNLTQEHRAEIRKEGYSQCVRALLLNWRQGTVACKDRSEVAFSNKKPWKQKGTGRARAGSARSPLWRKGGVIFGPQERTRTLAISKDLRRKVANTLLWDFLENKRVVALDWTPLEGTPKTSHAYKALQQAGLQERDIILFVTPHDRFAHASFANLPNVRMLLYDQWNAYDLSNGELWMFLEKDKDAFKEMVNRWI